jgi:hypothetical protein
MSPTKARNAALIVATWNHEAGYKFNICYRTRGGFLRAYARSKNASLDNAVDGHLVIRPINIQQYKEGKLK